jgi:hypothetical protein
MEQRDYRDWEGYESRELERGRGPGRGRWVGRGGSTWGGGKKMDFSQVVGAAMRQELGVRKREKI